MKLLQNMRKFIINNTFVFLCFITLMFFSVCGVLFTFNLIANAVENNEKNLEEERTYIIEINGACLDEKLNAVLLGEKTITHIYCIIDNHGEMVIADYYGNFFNRAGVSFGKWFSEDDLNDGAKKVILPNYPYISEMTSLEVVRYNIGDSYNICGTNYEAIGVGLLSIPAYQISYNSISNKTLISKVAVATEKTGSKEDIDSFCAHLEDTLDGEVITMPSAGKATSFWDKYAFETVLVCGIILTSVFNLAYVYSYILGTRKKEIAISRILGQNIISAILQIYAEVFILSTAVYIICMMLMKIILYPLLIDQGFLFKHSMNGVHYLMTYIIFIVIYSGVFLPLIIKQVKKTPASALTDEG